MWFHHHLLEIILNSHGPEKWPARIPAWYSYCSSISCHFNKGGTTICGNSLHLGLKRYSVLSDIVNCCAKVLTSCACCPFSGNVPSLRYSIIGQDLLLAVNWRYRNYSSCNINRRFILKVSDVIWYLVWSNLSHLHFQFSILLLRCR